MKKLIILFLSILFLNGYGQEFKLDRDTFNLSEVVITSFSPFNANKYTPVTFKNLSKSDITIKNYGQEPSRILSSTPSITTYSESGGDWGYSYIRMRGIDQTRINVTLNGVPMNEPEDQGCYFSNYPDLLQSVEFLQIQRGTGITKNGTSSFIGSMNFESYKSNEYKTNVYLGGGSYGSNKFSFSTENKLIYVSVSKMSSDGYKEHSGNRALSIFFTSNYTKGKNQFKIIGFVGEQANKLAWLGSPIDSINKNRIYNANTNNEKDHFYQQHIQFHRTYNINKNSYLKYTIYYNHLDGWYIYDGIHFGDTNLYTYNFISNFIGTNINYYKKIGNLDLYTGINGNKYSREHLGTSNSNQTDVLRFNKKYINTGYRDDISTYLKTNLKIDEFNIYSDIQYRYTTFKYDGDVYMKPFKWSFLNYSFGISYNIDNSVLYYNTGGSSREPIRNDIFGGYDNLNSDSTGAIYYDLKPENVLDQEFGYRYNSKKISFNVNFYYMMFKNELLLTDDYGVTGLPLHINVDESNRSGLEIDFKYKLNSNLTFSQNLSYNNSEIEKMDKQTTSTMTPKYLSNTELNYNYKWLVTGISGRYQSMSYIDINNEYTIPDFYVINLMGGVRWKWGEWNIYLNNITNQKYFSNGMMGGVDYPLYFVSTPFNLFTGIKINIK